MKHAIRCAVIAIACGILLAGVARSEFNDANVTDGPSRAELFEMRARADLGRNFSTLSATLAQPFQIPTHVLGDAVYGIDVSHHFDENCACKAGQTCNLCKINWNRVASQKVAFVYVKATQGARFKDPTFEHHWRTLAQHGIHRGAFHFMSADVDPVEQADHFVDRLEALGKLMASDLPPCLDLEADLRKDASKKWIVADSGEKLDFWKGQEPEEILGKILRWLNRVEQRTGRVPMIYTSRGWWMERIKDERKFALLRRYPLWISNFPESGRHAHDAPKVPNNQAWVLWQFSEVGRMADQRILPGNISVNVFRGTLVNFRRALGAAPLESAVARANEEKDASKAAQQPAPAAVQTPPSDTSKRTAQATSASASQQANAPDAGSSAQKVAAINPNQLSDASGGAQQAAVGNQGEAAGRNIPAQQAASATPNQSAGGEKPAQQSQPAQRPQQAQAAQKVQQVQAAQQSAEANKPAQQAATANPSQAQNTGAPAQQSQPAQPARQTQQAQPVQQAQQTQQTQQAQQAKPAQQVQQPQNSQPPQQSQQTQQAPAVAASKAAEASKPAQQAAPATPSQAAASSGAAQQAASANKPAPQAEGANASQPAAAVKPAEQTGSVKGNEQKAAPASQVAVANPGDQKAPPNPSNQAAENQKANTGGKAAPPGQTPARDSAQRTPAEKASTEKIMIEIELANGRKVRVDANIDPSVLSRLIAAIDK